MGYQLRMSGEIHDWLIELASEDPAAARGVGRALTTLIEEGARLGAPVVIPLAPAPGPRDLPDALDRAYQDLLERYRMVRARLAETAKLRQEIRAQISELEALQAWLAERLPPPTSPAGPGAAAELTEVTAQLDGLRELLSGVAGTEQELGRLNVRHARRADAFRIRKEGLTASYIAAQAELEIHEALAATGDSGSPAADHPAASSPDIGSSDAGQGEPGVPVGQDGPITGHPADGTARPPDPVAMATSRLAAVTGAIERELRAGRASGELLELRPAAAAGSDIRILFAVEPPGTALLIAVLDGDQAVRDEYGQAVVLASEVLRRARSGQAPEAAAYAFADTRSFADEFFPGRALAAGTRGGDLAAGHRVRTLAEQRADRELSRAEVARRMSVPEEVVATLEDAELAALEIGTLTAYLAALDGRLDLVAIFDGERVLLR